MALQLLITNTKNILATAIFLTLSLIVNAQQEAQFTQYMYNTVIINPAYAGSRGCMSFNTLYRSQWVGLEGAPKTVFFSLNTPISRKVGLGFSFYKNEIGPSVENMIATDYAYSVKLSRGITQLSFGIKAGIQTLDIDFSKLNIFSPLEQAFENNIDNRITPLLGLGAMLHNDKWYMGISAPNILQTEHYEDNSLSTATEKLHVFYTAGYVFDLPRDVQFKPAILAKYVAGAPLGLDLSANFLIYRRFTLGASYRLNAAASALVAIQLNNQIMIGYAYDTDATSLSNYNYGSHEVFLRFELLSRVRNNISPRFF
ncbi:PorP/SprF family type IX secretion system membrane protein [Poritiphilus flavus]|uniref:Type IX secretion system membrane protein PorP/SprF n=1 Tax=Poritiphilus flavus TaxID=2697053 RepID=A0A6L9E737_9FLAO|nr:type IX secretion system membrane protein PorP/SprF [Poritiphilus flavus]NAS10537.1 type IX secretion system membrane protein PorP/SprF [Poritiphilus flavus]